MNARLGQISAAVLMLAGTSALAGETHSYGAKYSKSQSAEEIEDIGEIDSVENAAFTRSKFRINATAREQYTTNAKLTGNHSSSDFIFLPTIDLGYETPLGKYFRFDISGRVESALYARYDERSFYGYSATATLDFRPNPKAPRIYVGLEPYRYVSYDTGDRITQALGVAVGTDYGYAFNGGRSLLVVGYSFTHYFSDPGIDERGQHNVMFGLVHAFTPRLVGQLYYSWQFSDFDIAREDSRHVVGGNLIYQFADHWFGSLTTNLVDLDSTQTGASYQSFGVSLGVSAQF